jgi:hypothetical protein
MSRLTFFLAILAKVIKETKKDAPLWLIRSRMIAVI